MSLSISEVRTVIEIYERTIHHPNLGGLRTWALLQLNALNKEAVEIVEKQAAQAKAKADAEAAEAAKAIEAKAAEEAEGEPETDTDDEEDE